MDHQESDSRWDYDCPQYVDFTAPMPFNDGADQMFESTVIGEGPSTSTVMFLGHGVTEHSESDPTSKEPTGESDAPAANTKSKEDKEEEKAEQPEKDCENVKEQKKPSNLVTSLDKWKNPNKHASTAPDESPNSKKARRNAVLDQEKTAAPRSMLTRSKSVRIPKSSSVSSLHTQKSGVTGTSAEPRAARSHTRTFSQGRSSVDLGKPAETKVATSTSSRQPKVPSLLKRLGEGLTSKLKSTEDLEMDRIKQLKKELQHKRQMAQESYKKAMSKAVPVAVHSKDPTVPQEFHFKTDKRLKTLGDKVEGKTVGDFVRSLRSRSVVSPASSTCGPKKLTVPQPFHLTEKATAGSSHASGDSKFESMAEKVKAFHRKTPERFRARARSGEKTHVRGARSISPCSKLTQPHTPNLMARGRLRPTHFLSQEQLEVQEVEDMKQNQFKARPVNTKILNNSGIGVKKVPSKPATEPEEFALSTGIQKKKEAEDEQYEFHANPVNKKIFEGPVDNGATKPYQNAEEIGDKLIAGIILPQFDNPFSDHGLEEKNQDGLNAALFESSSKGLKPVKPALPTVPMSPAFALKHRVRLPVEVPEEKNNTSSSVRAKPVPHTGIPFQPKLPHQHTVPEPFIVEERSKAMLAQKEEKIRQVLEEEKRAREFHAQPLPNQDVGGLPEKIVKESTKLEPFALETDQRGVQYKQDMAHKVGISQLTEEEEEQKKAMQFRAQPNRTIYKKPFIPASSTKALTEVSDFELNSDRRAVQREEFEMRKKERECELEGYRRQKEVRDKEEEEAAIAKLRAEMVHRPNPIRLYNPLIIQPSDKPLTDAESPQFSDRLRTKVRL